MPLDASAMAAVAGALAVARDLGVDRLDAQLLLAHQLGRSRAWLTAHEDAPLDAATAQAVGAMFLRRAAGEPLAYVVGEREFHGLGLRITPDVLVPRPDTETLVDWALEILSGPLQCVEAPRVVDLGTGSGAIALALKHACPRAQVHASDISAKAVAVARRNGERLQLPVRWYQGDWWQAVPLAELAQVDLVLANPPYIRPGDPHLADLRHEPLSALVARGDSGDGLADIERIAVGTASRLQAGGWLLLEHGFEQASAVCQHLLLNGFSNIETRPDMAGRPRVSGGRFDARGR